MVTTKLNPMRFDRIAALPLSVGATHMHRSVGGIWTTVKMVKLGDGTPLETYEDRGVR